MNGQRDIKGGVAEGGAPAGEGRNLIVVIGIDRYRDMRHWQRLSNAVSDARGVAALFDRLGFAPAKHELIDDAATGQAIQSLVTDDLTTLGSDDSLVLFYAGHGGNQKRRIGDRDITIGYLIPVDAEGQRVATWVNLEAWLNDVALLPPKHILVILDACHSGIALDPVIKWRQQVVARYPPGDAEGTAQSTDHRIGARRPACHGWWPLPGALAVHRLSHRGAHPWAASNRRSGDDGSGARDASAAARWELPALSADAGLRHVRVRRSWGDGDLVRDDAPDDASPSGHNGRGAHVRRRIDAHRSRTPSRADACHTHGAYNDEAAADRDSRATTAARESCTPIAVACESCTPIAAVQENCVAIAATVWAGCDATAAIDEPGRSATRHRWSGRSGGQGVHTVGCRGKARPVWAVGGIRSERRATANALDPAGSVLMGSPETELGRFPNEGPQHSVILTRGFWLGETPVTLALWVAVMGQKPSQSRGYPSHELEQPVEFVSWDDCQAFFDRLNAQVSGLAATLPTEAQWERACRAGTTTATWVGDLSEEIRAPELDAIAWYVGNSNSQTHPVRGKAPNPYGLHDMLGSVYEWCLDTAEHSGKLPRYVARPVKDPVAAGEGSYRVCRGGSRSGHACATRAAYRNANPQGSRFMNLGFRLAGGQG